MPQGLAVPVSDVDGNRLEGVTTGSKTRRSVSQSKPCHELEVGGTQPLQALDTTAAPVTGLTWTSDNPAVVTVSTDPEPTITALAPGFATIEAGGATVDVTVYAEGEIPEGAVLWSVPGPMAGVADIKVAVPYEGAVADVFAIGSDGTVQAVASDGTVGWTVPGPLGAGADSRPDFQGGLVVFDWDHIVRLDAATGQPTTLYGNANDETEAYGLSTPAIHPDGTVMTVDYTCHDFCDGADPDDSAAVAGIDVATGAHTFRVPLANSIYTNTNAQDAAFCGNSDGNGTFVSQYHAWPNNQLTIAADGFAYLSYLTYESTATEQRAGAQPYPDAAYNLFDQMEQYALAHDWTNALATLDALEQATGEPNSFYGNRLRTDYTNGDYPAAVSDQNGWAPQFQRACDSTETLVTKMHLMRVNAQGESSDVVVQQWTAQDQVVYTLNPSTHTYTSVETHSGPSDVSISEHIITNADQGALYSWQATETCDASGTFGDRTYTQVDACPDAPEDHLTTAADSISADVVWNPGAAPGEAIEPVLQLENGDFAGTISGWGHDTLVIFDGGGSVRWTEPESRPLHALAAGGLTATTAGGRTDFDASGNVVGVRAPQGSFSWVQETIAASFEAIASLNTAPPRLATSYTAVPGGNLSGNGTAIGMTENIEGWWIFGRRSSGPTCTLPPIGGQASKPPLAGDVRVEYDRLKADLLASGSLSSVSCSSFFNAPERQAALGGCGNTAYRHVESLIPDPESLILNP